MRLPRVLRRIAECESGGDPTAVSPDGRYRGKYQFTRSTWRALGGDGDPADASEADAGPDRAQAVPAQRHHALAELRLARRGRPARHA